MRCIRDAASERPRLDGGDAEHDVSGVGSVENLEGVTNLNGEQTTTVTPSKGGTIDVLAQVTGADGKTLFGVAQIKVADRRNAKIGSKLYTTVERTFVKQAGGYVQSSATKHDGARTLHAGSSSNNWWDRFCNWIGDLTKGTSEESPAFNKGNKSAQETIQGGVKATGLYPAQLILGSPLLGANGLSPAMSSSGQVIAAGGGNVVAAGGGNVIAAGGGNVVAAGGGNVVAAGGGNVIAAGGGNLVVGSKAGVIAAGGGNVIAAGGGNVVAAGGGNVIAAGGGNVIAAGGLN